MAEEKFKYPEDTTFDEDFAIDLYNLHGEWQVQGHLRHKYGRAYATAVYEERQTRKIRNRVKARVGLKVRGDPIKFDLGSKPTEGAIKAAVDLDDRVIEAENDLAEATYRMELLKSAVFSMGDKKNALQEEVKLFISEYYEDKGVPKVIRDMASELARRDQFEALSEDPALTKRRASNGKSNKRKRKSKLQRRRGPDKK